MVIKMMDSENSFYISNVAKITKVDVNKSYCVLAKWEVTFKDGTTKKFPYHYEIAEVQDES